MHDEMNAAITGSAEPRPYWPAAALLLVTLLLIGGCETLGYYSQAVAGQLGVLHKRQPVANKIAQLQQIPDPAPRDLDLLAGLSASQEIIDFAAVELGIDPGRRYRTYVELSSPHVIWNVFAAPELDLQARTWCYPMVGCAPYRGYFNETRAERYADKLARQGFDVYLGGVAAYSTLGWFADPLLSSFIDWPEANLAELLIHELAHGRVWVKGDVDFNEAFATFVGYRGAVQFVAQREGAAGVGRYLQRRGEWQAMVDLLLQIRSGLQILYGTGLDDAVKRREKSALLERAVACYEDNRARLGSGRFDAVMSEVNNAYLVSLATYQDNVPAFARIYSQRGDNWQAFFAAVEELAQLPADIRQQRLAELREQQVAQAGYDQNAHQVQCKSLFSHRFDAEASGTEHDHVRGGSHG